MWQQQTNKHIIYSKVQRDILSVSFTLWALVLLMMQDDHHKHLVNELPVSLCEFVFTAQFVEICECEDKQDQN